MINRNRTYLWMVVVALAGLAALNGCGQRTPAPPSPTAEGPLSPAQYRALMGKGLAVDWAKTPHSRTLYSPEDPVAVRQRGFSHVRIRVREDVTPALLQHLDGVIADSLHAGLLPVLAYKGEAFKTHPTEANLEKVVQWWGAMAEHYQDASPRLSFDLLIEVTDALNRQPDMLNWLYERAVAEIRKTNPTRLIFISPRQRSNPYLLPELRIPPDGNGYLMAEWHFYAAGPSKTNPAKRWTQGTDSEKRLVQDKIAAALAWQRQTGLYTWVGAWMPGDYNHGDHYTVPEQVRFATFVSCQLDAAHIPFAVNSDAKFYDREHHRWIPAMAPVLDAVLHPRCTSGP